jgi:DnaJ-class molecular chaperone
MPQQCSDNYNSASATAYMMAEHIVHRYACTPSHQAIVPYHKTLTKCLWCVACRKGDAAPGVPPGVPPGPVVLVLAGSPHPVFTRQLSDLVARVQLPLLKALTGGTVSLKTLDGR